MKDIIGIYRAKRMKNTDSWRLEPSERLHAPTAESTYEIPVAICIPVCNEYPCFFETLDSLEKSTTITYESQKQDKIAVFCAINNRASDKSEVIENNHHLLNVLNCIEVTESTPKKLETVLSAPEVQPTPKKLETVSYTPSTVERWPHLELFVIDCCTSGRELPEGQGVGLARKIAMDSALCFGAKVIACLDADTFVKDNYISVLLEYGKNNNEKIAATCTSFVHQKGSSTQIENAIRAYEKFLHHHADSLKKCGTPFYHVALGPTLVCTSEAYCACNGMNPRVAGEDFYFLQSLEKVCANSGGVTEIDTCVYPSPRISDRVLFGTGTKIQGIIDGTDDATLYPDCVYKSVADFITLVKNSIQDFCNATAIEPESSPKNALQSGKNATQTMSSALRSSMTIRLLQKKMQDDYPAFYEFFNDEHFFDTWEKVLQHSSTDTKKLEDAFFAWFDGLKIIRFFHYLMR